MHKQEVNRLKFLEDFMKAAGVSTSRLAGLMGITRQADEHCENPGGGAGEYQD